MYCSRIETATRAAVEHDVDAVSILGDFGDPVTEHLLDVLAGVVVEDAGEITALAMPRASTAWPPGRSSGARSTTVTSAPRRTSQCANAGPAILAPAIRIGCRPRRLLAYPSGTSWSVKRLERDERATALPVARSMVTRVRVSRRRCPGHRGRWRR